jgi:hypothetical protein
MVLLVVGLCALAAATSAGDADRPVGGGDSLPAVEVAEADAAAADGPAPPADSSLRPPAAAQPRRLPLKLAFRATRPWSFPATISPVALGTALAFQLEDKFRPLRLLLSLVVTLSVHAAGNLMNTYFDFKNGVDSASSSDRTLVDGQLEPSHVARLISWSYAIAACAALPLPLVSRAPLPLLLAHLVAGAASAFVYTGGPGLKYRRWATCSSARRSAHC